MIFSEEMERGMFSLMIIGILLIIFGVYWVAIILLVLGFLPLVFKVMSDASLNQAQEELRQKEIKVKEEKERIKKEEQLISNTGKSNLISYLYDINENIKLLVTSNSNTDKKKIM